MENKTISLSFGVLSPTISSQLKKQKLKFNKDHIAYFEKERTAINTLRFGNNLLTEAMAEKLIQKMFDKIKKHIISQNKPVKK